MAFPQQQTKQETRTPAPAPNVGGKPAKPETKTPQEKAVANLQYAVDRSCIFIHDGGSSVAHRAKIAAKRGIPRERVEKGLSLIESAMKDARAAVEKAYTVQPKTTKEAPKSRGSI